MMNVPSEPAMTEHFDTLRLCKQHEKEIRTLRQELAMHDTLTNRSQISYEPLSESQIQDVREQVKRFLSGELNDIELVNVRQIKETFAQFRVIVNSVESEVEERLRQKYVLQERDGVTSGKYQAEMKREQKFKLLNLIDSQLRSQSIFFKHVSPAMIHSP